MLPNKHRFDAYCIKNVLIAQPDSEYYLQKVNIYVKNKVIHEITLANEISVNESTQEIVTFDWEGFSLSVGWLDAGAEFQYPGEEWKESLKSFGEAACRAGLTDVVVFPRGNVLPDEATGLLTLTHTVNTILGGIRIHPVAALTKESAGKQMAELAELIEIGAVALGDYKQFATNSSLLIRLMQYLKVANKLCLQFPKEAGLYEQAVATESANTTLLGLKAQPTLVETLAVERLAQITQYTGGKLAFLPITTQQSVEIVNKYRQKGVECLAITTAPYLYSTDACLFDFDTNYKLNPPLRTEADRAFLVQALIDHKVQGLASLHAPRSLEEKQLEFDAAVEGMIGLETMPAILYEVLLQATQNPTQASKIFIETLTLRNRQIYQLPYPTLTIGAPVCFTCFRTDHPQVYAHTFSICKNSPYLGQIFHLSVKAVCVGDVVFLNE